MKPFILSFLIAVPAAHAATFSLDLNAANGSRWYEYFSDAYAELGKNRVEGGDGFWAISTHGATTHGDGSSDVFLNNGVWNNFGSIGYSDAGLTGTGAESTGILSFAGNFSSVIADNDSMTNSGYTTTINSVTGTIHFINGVVSSVDMNAALTFTYDGSGFGMEDLDYTGNFIISGNTFTLDADGSYPTFPGMEDARYVWDVNGTVTNVIPEPSATLLGSLGLLILARRRR